MGEKGEGSGVVGGGKWGRRGREVGGKGEGTGNGVPPCPPPHQSQPKDIVRPPPTHTQKLAKYPASSFHHLSYGCLAVSDCVECTQTLSKNCRK